MKIQKKIFFWSIGFSQFFKFCLSEKIFKDIFLPFNPMKLRNITWNGCYVPLLSFYTLDTTNCCLTDPENYRNFLLNNLDVQEIINPVVPFSTIFYNKIWMNFYLVYRFHYLNLLGNKFKFVNKTSLLPHLLITS